MRLETWLLFVSTEIVLCLTPGPAVLLVLSTGLQRGVRRGILAALGILAANTVYFAISATGLGALVMASPWLYQTIKWLGVLYLVYLGLNDILRPSGTLPNNEARPHGARDFHNGFVLQIANPKAIVFFAALLPQFLDPAQSVPWQIAILAISSVCVEFTVLSGYSTLAGRAAKLVREESHVRTLHRIAGAMLIAAATVLAVL